MERVIKAGGGNQENKTIRTENKGSDGAGASPKIFGKRATAGERGGEKDGEGERERKKERNIKDRESHAWSGGTWQG